MNRLLFVAAFLIVLGATLASGWVHGELVNRWGQEDALALAAGRLGSELPARLGPWRLVDAVELEKEVVDALRARSQALCDRRPLYPGFRGYPTYVTRGDA